MAEAEKTRTKKGNATWITTVVILAALIVGAIIGVERSNAAKPVQTSYQAMGTVISSTLYGKQASKTTDEVQKEIVRLENEDISWRIKGSDVWKINHDGSATVSDATAKAISESLEVAAASDGNYDITIGKVTTLWNIGTDDARVPSSSEIQSALSSVDYRKVHVDGNKVTIGEGQFLDLGGIGKGYACDMVKPILEQNKIKGGVVAVGGSILLYGTNPNKEGGLWTVGVQDPARTHNDTCMTFTSGPCCVSTSGDYEKVLEQDGKRYHHIIDPRTGFPAESDLTSVTVIADSGALTDELATCCYLYGYNSKSLDLLKKFHAEGIFIKKDGTVYATSGVRDKITFTNEDYHF